MIVIGIFAVLFLFFALLSLKKVHNSKDRVQFIYHWGWFIGAFVWEDLFIFSVLGVFITSMVLLLRDIRIAYLSFTVFWIVRSAGETLYFFLEQFTKDKMYPHVLTHHFAILRNIFGEISDQKCFIIMQIAFQTILVCSIVSTIYILLNWHTLGA